MSPKEYFEKNRYVYLSNVLPKDTCDEITKYIWNLKEQGKLVQDEQCPKSWSVYGDPLLDQLLENFAKPLSQQLGLELLPAYTYCRLYQPGEVLKRHIDRQSCEISGTLTLGYDPESEIWPIFFTNDPEDAAGQAVQIDVGDMVMYRGNELTHWRPKYIGKWQVQVFLHYVDANGPHKEWAYDKRPGLGVQAKPTTESKWKKHLDAPVATKNNISAKYNAILIDDGNDVFPELATFHTGFHPELAFTPEECNKIIQIAKEKYPTKARVGTGQDGKYEQKIRRVDNYHISCEENTKWIFDKLIQAVGTANKEYYNFELAGITHELQLLHYKSDEKAFYDWHVDVGTGQASKRKLSIVCMLSDPAEYEGGKLLVNNGIEVECINTKGSINMFPSYMLHTVTPVTKGERWVLVIWVHGSQRFR